MRGPEAAWREAGCPGTDDDPLPAGRSHLAFLAFRVAWKALENSFLQRLRSGALHAWARRGTALGDWIKIPPDSWGALRIKDYVAGIAEGGREELYSIRVAKPDGLPLDIALRAFGDPAKVALLDNAEKVLAEFHFQRPASHPPPPQNFRVSDITTEISRQLKTDLVANLAAGSLVGLLPGSTSVRVPPEQWSRLAADSASEATIEESLLERVLIVPARFAPASKAPAKAHTVADERACQHWLEQEWLQTPRRPKAAWLELAKQQWPQLADEGFERAWAETRKTHPAMGKPGRPKGG
jgi:hypothetical protein